MGVFLFLLLITQIILISSEPIDGGTDVGTIQVHNGKKIVLNPAKFPYVVYLQIESFVTYRNPLRVISEVSSCGGVLLRRNLVLTASHCVDDNPVKVTAWLGIVDRELEKGRGQQILVKGFTKHPNFIRSKEVLQNVNDIAILWLTTPAQLDGKYITLANLPAANFDAVGKQGWIVGWGCQSCGGTKSMLQKAFVRGVSWAKCQNYYKYSKIVDTFICIMADNEKATSTEGDSGSPFIIQGMVIGLCSFGAVDWSKGAHASDAKKPAAYTYVPKYLDWIESTLKQEPKVLLASGKQPPQRPPPPRPPSPPHIRPSSPTRNPSRPLSTRAPPPRGPPHKILKRH